MEANYTQDQKYRRAQKKVKKIKGFYVHLIVYILVNLFLSGIIVNSYMNNGYSLIESLSEFGVYSTAFFWGIGLFFHWLGVFGFKSLFSSNWEERKIKEFMDKS